MKQKELFATEARWATEALGWVINYGEGLHNMIGDILEFAHQAQQDIEASGGICRGNVWDIEWYTDRMERETEYDIADRYDEFIGNIKYLQNLMERMTKRDSDMTKQEKENTTE